MSHLLRIGIDLGGTKTEGIVLSPEGAELVRTRIATPRTGYGDVLGGIVRLVDDLKQAAGHPEADVRIGVGIPGAVCPHSSVVKNANLTALIGHPFDRDLSAALGTPVRVANDANCFAVSEAVDGAAAGLPVVFGVILGTGCGGGLAIDGVARTGPNAIAGEWGHNPLPWPRDDERPGPPCYCGKTGCTETWISGPGFEATYAARGRDALSSSEIVARAGQGDDDARAVLELYLDRLARSLATVINIVDPDAVVFGGGMSNISQIYTAMPAQVPGYVFSGDISTAFLQNVHGDSSGVRGAAWLWPPDGARA